MSVLVTADIHLDDEALNEHRHTFMEKTLPKLLKETGAGALFILGDLTRDKDHHSGALVNRLVQGLHTIAQRWPVVIQPGNHDYTADPETPFYRFLARVPGIVWVNTPPGDSPQLLKLTRDVLKGSRCCFLPHTRDYKAAWEGLDFSAYDWIFAHQTFAGCDIGRGKRLAGIPPDIFKGTQVISGDIHIPQSFEGVTYVGAPYLCNFGDAYEPRVLLLDNFKMKSIPVPGVQKRLVEIKHVNELPDWDLSGNDILKIRYHLESEDRASWPTIQEHIHDWCKEQGLICHTIQPVGGGLTKTRRIDRKTTPRSDEQLLTEYGKKYGIDDRTLQVGLAIVKQS